MPPTEIKNIKDALSKFASAIKDAVVDLATVDVATFTGDVQLQIESEKSSLDATALYEKLKGTTGGQLILVALTHVEIDMDATNFVMLNASENLLTLHNGAVKTALETRAAVVDMVRGLIGLG